MISHFLHVPFPEKLSDTEWSEKWAQVQFLKEKGIIGQSSNEPTTP